ncbi:MAG: DUF342 domain-containing protein [Planctomycetota bacterium]|jgi:uncharacterized protein (DUF342 family)
MTDAAEKGRLFTLETNEDSTELVLSVAPGADPEKPVDRVLLEAGKMGITVDIDKAAIKEAFRKARDNGAAPVIIARGKPCQHGRDATLLWSKKITGKREKGGRLSHYLGQIQKRIVHMDDPVAKLVREKPGEDGMDVCGRVIKADKGRPLKMRKGSGIRESDGVFFAEKDGMVHFEDDLIRLDEIFVVDGTLDFETGNIDFPGSVVIEGDILDLFEITAGGSIEIKGLVEGANLTAKGDIEIGGGVAGKTKGRIVTNSSVAAKFLINAYVYAEGDVMVEGEVVSSKVAAFGALGSPECSIAGGEVEAIGGIDVAAIGSDLAVKTVVGAGVGPAHVALIESNAAEIAKTRDLLIELKKSLQSTSRTVSVQKVEEARKEITRIHSGLLTALQLRKKLALSVRAAKPVIRASRMIYPGVELRVGTYKMSVDEKISGPVKLVPDDKNRTVRVKRIG